MQYICGHSSDDRHPNTCKVCWSYDSFEKYKQKKLAERTELPAATTAQPKGPGTELMNLLASMGITARLECGCKNKAAQMDEWGVEGCRQRRSEITNWLREEAAKRSWFDKLQSARRAIFLGLALEISPVDIYGSLVDMAIYRAESKQSNRGE